LVLCTRYPTLSRYFTSKSILHGEVGVEVLDAKVDSLLRLARAKVNPMCNVEADAFCGRDSVQALAEVDTFRCAEVDTLCGGRHFVLRSTLCAEADALFRGRHFAWRPMLFAVLRSTLFTEVNTFCCAEVDAFAMLRTIFFAEADTVCCAEADALFRGRHCAWRPMLFAVLRATLCAKVNTLC
jgi:hypothetical protein